MEPSCQIWSMNFKAIFSRYVADIIDLLLNILTLVPDISTVKLMKFICYLLELHCKIMQCMGRIGIECKMQQILGYYIKEEYACMLHIILLRALFSQKCEILV